MPKREQDRFVVLGKSPSNDKDPEKWRKFWIVIVIGFIEAAAMLAIVIGGLHL